MRRGPERQSSVAQTAGIEKYLYNEVPHKSMNRGHLSYVCLDNDNSVWTGENLALNPCEKPAHCVALAPAASGLVGPSTPVSSVEGNRRVSSSVPRFVDHGRNGKRHDGMGTKGKKPAPSRYS
jgi:hypothetical protein